MNIQCQMDSLHNLLSSSSAGQIAYIICHPAVRTGRRTASYVGYLSGNTAGRQVM